MTATSPYDELTPESIKASMLSDLTAKGVDVSIRGRILRKYAGERSGLSAVQDVPAVPELASHGLSG